MLYLSNLSKPIVKYEQIKNMNLGKKLNKNENINDKNSKETVFTDDDFKKFAKSYFSQ